MTKWIVVFLSGLTLAAAQPNPNAAKEVLAASEAWRQAMLKKDAAGLQKFLHEDLTYSHSNARNQTKADVVQTTTAGKTTIEAMDFSEVTVRVYGTTALIRANVDIRNSTDGKSTTSHLNVLHVWLKGPGGWQLVARQSTQVSPPTTP
jgi:ketosteroid isomerase-like protein